MKTDDPHPLFPGLWGALWLVLAGLVGETFMMALLSDLLPDADHMEQAALARLLASAVLFTGLMSFKRLRYAELFHAGPSSVGATLALTLLPAVAMVPGLLVVIGWVSGLVSSVFPLSSWEQQAFAEMASPTPAALIMVCLMGPVLEEMLFRGVILRSFLRRYPPGTAIVHSAAVFGLAHMNVYQFFVGLMLGGLLGWLYERTRSLWPCIALHVAYNAGVTWLDIASARGGAVPDISAAELLSSLLAVAWLARFLGMPGQRR